MQGLPLFNTMYEYHRLFREHSDFIYNRGSGDSDILVRCDPNKPSTLGTRLTFGNGPLSLMYYAFCFYRH